jgi:hypothetical protein
MKRLLTVLFVLGILLGTTDFAAATPFRYPPENGDDWITSFPYQRNITWDFDKDPTLTPSTYPNDPAYDVRYEGYDDQYLWMSDYVAFTGGVEYFADLTAIGIDNSNGQETTTGYAVFHIDNWDRPGVKHIWWEAEIERTPPYESRVTPVLYAQGISWGLSWSYEDGLMYGGHALPVNPPWENFYLKITACPGEAVYVDEFHIATECVHTPAPGAIWLGGLGVSLVGWLRRRRAF